MWASRLGATGVGLTLALATGLGGCAGSGAEVRTLRTELASLRAEHERTLSQVDQLENQLSMMESRLRPARASAAAAAAARPIRPGVTARPKLKVVKLRAPSSDDSGDGWTDADEWDAEQSRGKKSARASIKIYETPTTPIDASAGAPPIPVPSSGTVVTGAPPRWEGSGYPDPATVNERLPVPPGKAPPIPARPATVPAAPAAPDETQSAPPADSDAARATALFNKAYLSFTRLAYADAESGFRTFVSRYPTHENADAAVYWLGESLYARGAFEDAIRNFRDLGARFPKSTKAPYALLKTGYCYAALKDLTRAREVLAEVIRRHPRTDAAKLAAVRLTELLKG